MFGNLNSLGNLSSLGAHGDTKRLQLSELFPNNTEGIYLPSLRDAVSQGNMFQDSTGTIPVTGVEQPVGLVLEGSKGVELGPELVTNGDFSDGLSGWAVCTVAGSYGEAYNGGAKVGGAVGNGALTRDIGLVSGKCYVLEYQVVEKYGPLALALRCDGEAAFSGSLMTLSNRIDSHKLFFIASGGSQITLVIGGGDTWGLLDNISVREVLGNHLIQPTDADRPILSARVNMLENTEDLTADSFSTVNITKGINYIQENSANQYHQMSQGVNLDAPTVFSVEAKLKNGTRYLGLGPVNSSSAGSAQLGVFDLENGIYLGEATYGTGTSLTGKITALNDGWYRCEVSVDKNIDNLTSYRGSTIRLMDGFEQGTTIGFLYRGDGTSAIYIRNVDLRSADQATGLLPDYQRVGDVDTDPTDYDWQNFPWYLAFNGVNTWMYVPNMTPNSDEVFVAVGVRKKSDAAVSHVYEYTATYYNNGAFVLLAPYNGSVEGYQWFSRGTAFSPITYTSGYKAPVTDVITTYSNISGDSNNMSINGYIKSSSANQGSGNYANDNLYIGSRAGSAYFFNGNIYSLILAFKIPSNRVISKVERLVNQKTKAY